MTGIWLLVLATAATPAEIADSANAGTAVVAAVAPETQAVKTPGELRDAVAAALRRLDTAKASDRSAAIKSLIDVYQELGHDQLLKPFDRSRLGTQVRTRLERAANQLRYASKQAAAQPAAGAEGAKASAESDAPDTVAGWINQVVGGPGDWILAQRVGGPAGGQGGFAAGGAGNSGKGTELDQAVNANGAALVNLIQKTIAPNSWDVNGGEGSVTFYNNLRALVVRQTEEVHSDLDAVLNGLRKQ